MLSGHERERETNENDTEVRGARGRKNARHTGHVMYSTFAGVLVICVCLGGWLYWNVCTASIIDNSQGLTLTPHCDCGKSRVFDPKQTPSTLETDTLTPHCVCDRYTGKKTSCLGGWSVVGFVYTKSHHRPLTND